MKNFTLRTHLDGRMGGLRTARYSQWAYWAEIATYVRPYRYRWLVTPNQWNRGAPFNQQIIDSTGTLASNVCSSGMMSGICSPTRPWFKLQINGVDSAQTNPVSLWLAECELRLMKIFQDSNFYTSVATLLQDLVDFGTAPMLIYEDFKDVIRCYNPCAGEYFVDCSEKLQVDVFYREFVMTIAAIMRQWPDEESWSPTIKQALDPRNAGMLSQEIRICHAIEPNTDGLGGVSKRFAFREVYWEWGQPKDLVLSQRGFHEFPGPCPRWSITSNYAYGNQQPGSIALGDIKQLQQETKRKGQGIDKMVNPPMVADIQLKNQPASSISGGITYVTGFSSGGRPGFAPAYTVQPQLADLNADIKEVQLRIQRAYYNDLFLMFQQLQAEPRSAAAVDARREEKLIMLGPVLERFQNEFLDVAITRTFNIALRTPGVLPPPPEEIAGQAIDIVYMSMLAQAQKAVATTSIERVLGLAGSVAAVKPEIVDNIDEDEAVGEYANLLGVSPKIIRNPKQVAAIRQQRAQQQQQQQQAALTAEAVKGAKVLSETNTGAGQNALQQMLGQSL